MSLPLARQVAEVGLLTLVLPEQIKIANVEF
ncbi:hypothetical protein BN874_2540004 [Candidatus Contendobacter odensis Run_B_J11]|uniref:Uncharacterized protein n=1 Tax=Candidatus Contendobacter odensis Run_B_J11 TaxID=1400861 RepID=A0A7U7J4E8_9GAMM|nr:hypothetical protein BN874_2540004 [Candidatus Contendobacter odensis Run_B_J11]